MMNIQIKQVFYYGVGMLALIALASPYPTLATLFVILLITGVLLSHASLYASYLETPKTS